MANKVWTENWQHNSDANFRLWGLAITAALTTLTVYPNSSTDFVAGTRFRVFGRLI